MESNSIYFWEWCLASFTECLRYIYVAVRYKSLLFFIIIFLHYILYYILDIYYIFFVMLYFIIFYYVNVQYFIA